MQVDRSFIVYRHIFPNGKSYIGITKQLPVRRWCNGHGYDKQPKMANAIRKYGVENIIHELLDCCLTFDEAKEAEKKYIAKFNTITNGYNITKGGDGRLGVPCSEETKAKIGLANKGKSNPNAIKNLQRFQKQCGAWNKGKKLTGQHLEKIIAERQQRCNKTIIACNPITHLVEREYESCTIAAISLGVSKSVISRCAKGGRKTAAGYEWRYKNESV